MIFLFAFEMAVSYYITLASLELKRHLSEWPVKECTSTPSLKDILYLKPASLTRSYHPSGLDSSAINVGKAPVWIAVAAQQNAPARRLEKEEEASGKS